MGKSTRLPETKKGVTIADWLQRVAADHDGVPLIVAKTVGSLNRTSFLRK
jgi:hypothetical protein